MDGFGVRKIKFTIQHPEGEVENWLGYEVPGIDGLVLARVDSTGWGVYNRENGAVIETGFEKRYEAWGRALELYAEEGSCITK